MRGRGPAINNPADVELKKTLSTDNRKALQRLGAQTNAGFLAAFGEV
jgi:hypothetical protein